MKLQAKAFALTSSVFGGFGLFFLTWWMILFKKSTGEKTLIGEIYRGYTVSPKGSVIGLFWGVIDGFVSGLAFAGLYNLFCSQNKHDRQSDHEHHQHNKKHVEHSEKVSLKV